MKQQFTLAAVCTAATLFAGQALAQSPSGSNEATNPTQQNSSLQEANTQEFFRSSDLVGKNTQDSQGKKVGEIKDITFNQQGQIFALVDIGGSKWAAVPWQVVNPATAKGRGNVTLNATHQQLQAGPAVTKTQWGSLNNPKFVEGAYSYYNVQAPTASGGASSPGGTQSLSSPASSSTQPSAPQPPATTPPSSTTPGQTDTNSTSAGQTDTNSAQPGSSSSQPGQ